MTNTAIKGIYVLDEWAYIPIITNIEVITKRSYRQPPLVVCLFSNTKTIGEQGMTRQ